MCVCVCVWGGGGGEGGVLHGIKQKKKFAQNIQTDLVPFPALISA